MERKFIIPQYVTGQDIRRVRKMLKMTQKEFANLIGSSRPTIERWEKSETPITGPIVLLLQMIERDQDYILYIQAPQKKKPLRLWYMHRQTVCTVIDVDDNQQEIEIHNYHNNILFRAFGTNEHPTYKDYQEFLESRCFPASRDKMKLILRDLDLPFYDPFMIIRKTEGRMAEDDFWIRIER